MLIKPQKKINNVFLFSSIGSEKLIINPKINPEIIEIKKDDLKQINGIGTTIEKKLNEIDIYNFYQISNLSKEDIETISEKIKTFPGKIERDNWVGQAQELLKEKS